VAAETVQEPFMDSSNFRKRVLHKLAEVLDLPKLTFQVIRRTISILGKTKGHVKNIQGMMRHSKASTTTDGHCRYAAPVQRLERPLLREGDFCIN
jgi:hypothetical protein